MKSLLLALTTVAAAALAPPAQGSPPGAHDQHTGGCGYTFINPEPSDPDAHFVGTFDAEVVWHAKSPGLNPTVTTASSLTCSLQTDYSYGSGTPVVSCHFTGPAPYLIVDTCVRTLPPYSGILFFCTTFVWTEAATTTYVENVDYDPSLPGDQCYWGFE